MIPGHVVCFMLTELALLVYLCTPPGILFSVNFLLAHRNNMNLEKKLQNLKKNHQNDESNACLKFSTAHMK